MEEFFAYHYKLKTPFINNIYSYIVLRAMRSAPGQCTDSIPLTLDFNKDFSLLHY